ELSCPVRRAARAEVPGNSWSSLLQEQQQSLALPLEAGHPALYGDVLALHSAPHAGSDAGSEWKPRARRLLLAFFEIGIDQGAQAGRPLRRRRISPLENQERHERLGVFQQDGRGLFPDLDILRLERLERAL